MRATHKGPPRSAAVTHDRSAQLTRAYLGATPSVPPGQAIRGQILEQPAEQYRPGWAVERPALRTGATQRGPRPPGSIVRGSRPGPPGRHLPEAKRGPVWALARGSRNASRARQKPPAGSTTAPKR